MNWIEWMGNDAWRASLKAVPMVPSVAREVLEFANDPHLSVNRIIGVVSRDPVLATRVLQLANSAYSASGVPVTGINQAVVRMGTDSVRRVITAVCVASILGGRSPYGSKGRELVDHGIGTAYLAAMIAEAVGESREEAFACGLLHDIGKLLIAHLAARPAVGVSKPTASEVAQIVEARHAEFGGYLMEWWRLPETLYEAVAFHDNPARASRPGLVHVTYAADRLAHRYSFGCEAESFDALADPVMAAVGVTDELLVRLDHQAPKLYELARQLAA